jgi:hypothetical protein
VEKVELQCRVPYQIQKLQQYELEVPVRSAVATQVEIGVVEEGTQVTAEFSEMATQGATTDKVDANSEAKPITDGWTFEPQGTIMEIETSGTLISEERGSEITEMQRMMLDEVRQMLVRVESQRAEDPEESESRVESRASLRRDRYPARPLSKQAELARLRRREKKVMYDELRALKKARKQTTAEPHEEEEEPKQPEEVMKIPIYGRQKWRSVSWGRSEGWRTFRKHVIRAFALKRTHWRFEEQRGQKEWLPVLQKPLELDAEKKYRIVLSGFVPRIRPGKIPRRGPQPGQTPKGTAPSPKIEKPERKPLVIDRAAPPLSKPHVVTRVDPLPQSTESRVAGFDPFYWEPEEVKENRRAEELRRAEEARRAEESRRAEELRRAEESRRAEETRRAEESRRAEELRRAEESRRAEEARRAAETRREAEARLRMRTNMFLKRRRESWLETKRATYARKTGRQPDLDEIRKWEKEWEGLETLVLPEGKGCVYDVWNRISRLEDSKICVWERKETARAAFAAEFEECGTTFERRPITEVVSEERDLCRSALAESEVVSEECEPCRPALVESEVVSEECEPRRSVLAESEVISEECDLSQTVLGESEEAERELERLKLQNEEWRNEANRVKAEAETVRKRLRQVGTERDQARTETARARQEVERLKMEVDRMRVKAKREVNCVRDEAEREVKLVREEAERKVNGVKAEAGQGVDRLRLQMVRMKAEAGQEVERLRLAVDRMKAEAGQVNHVKAEAGQEVERLRLEKDRMRVEAEREVSRVREEAEREGDRVKAEAGQEVEKLRLEMGRMQAETEREVDRVKAEAERRTKGVRAEAGRAMEQLRQESNHKLKKVQAELERQLEGLKLESKKSGEEVNRVRAGATREIERLRLEIRTLRQRARLEWSPEVVHEVGERHGWLW